MYLFCRRCLSAFELRPRHPYGLARAAVVLPYEQPWTPPSYSSSERHTSRITVMVRAAERYHKAAGVHDQAHHHGEGDQGTQARTRMLALQ